MPLDAVFNANEVAPKQGGGAHPVGNKWPFTITGTKVSGTKDNSGGMFEVEFTSNVGSITERYNLWNASEQARNIAKQELSALCHATGIFMLDFKNDGAALRGAKGLMDVGFQKGHEPSPEKPEGGYVELKKVYDLQGNEPGKGATAQSPQQNYQQGNAQQQPQGGHQGGPQVQTGNFNPNPQQTNQQPPNSGWNNGQQQQQSQPQNNNAGGWGQPQGQQQQPQQNNNAGGWQQNAGGGAPQSPPWGGGQ